MPEESAERAVTKKSFSERINEAKTEVINRAANGGEAAIHLIQEKFDKAYSEGLKGFGTLGENVRRVQGMQGNLDKPDQALQTTHLLEGINAQVGLKQEIVLPQGTGLTKEERVTKGIEMLKQEVAGLKDKLKGIFIDGVVTKKAEFDEKAKEAKSVIEKSKSRAEVRRTVYRLQNERIDYEYAAIKTTREIADKKASDEVKKLVREETKYVEQPPQTFTEEEQKQRTEVKAEEVLSTLEASDEVKARIDKGAKVFTEINQIDQKIENNNLNIGGREAQIEVGGEEKPAIVGAYLANPEVACDLFSENRHLEAVDKKRKVGEVRLMVAQERVALAGENWQKFGVRLTKGANWNEGVTLFKERAAARLNLVTETVKKNVGQHVDELVDSVDVAKSGVSEALEPVTGLFGTVGEGINGVVSKLQKAEEPHAVGDAIRESKAVDNVAKTAAGVKAEVKADVVKLREQVHHDVYDAELNFKAGLKRVVWEAKLYAGELIGGKEASQEASDKRARLEAAHDKLKARYEREIKRKLENNPKNKVFIDDLDKRFKVESPKVEPTPVTKDENLRNVRLIRQKQKGSTIYEFRAIYIDKRDNKVKYVKVDEKGVRTGEEMVFKKNKMLQENATEQEADQFLEKLIKEGKERFLAADSKYGEFDPDWHLAEKEPKAQPAEVVSAGNVVEPGKSAKTGETTGGLPLLHESYWDQLAEDANLNKPETRDRKIGIKKAIEGETDLDKEKWDEISDIKKLVLESSNKFKSNSDNLEFFYEYYDNLKALEEKLFSYDDLTKKRLPADILDEKINKLARYNAYKDADKELNELRKQLNEARSKDQVDLNEIDGLLTSYEEQLHLKLNHYEGLSSEIDLNGLEGTDENKAQELKSNKAEGETETIDKNMSRLGTIAVASREWNEAKNLAESNKDPSKQEELDSIVKQKKQQYDKELDAFNKG